MGRKAEPDDIAPEGQEIAQSDVEAHEKAMREAHEKLGLPTDDL